MTLKTPLLIAALAAAALTGPAGAQGRGPLEGDRPSFAELDADGDGMLSAEELRAPMADRFAAADVDGSGALSAEELAAVMEARMAERGALMAERILARRDVDGSGDLSLEELAAPQARPAMFDRLDTDGDGAISEEEFAAAIEGQGWRGHDGGGQGHRQGHGHGNGHGGGPL